MALIFTFSLLLCYIADFLSIIISVCFSDGHNFVRSVVWLFIYVSITSLLWTVRPCYIRIPITADAKIWIIERPGYRALSPEMYILESEPDPYKLRAGSRPRYVYC